MGISTSQNFWPPTRVEIPDATPTQDTQQLPTMQELQPPLPCGPLSINAGLPWSPPSLDSAATETSPLRAVAWELHTGSEDSLNHILQATEVSLNISSMSNTTTQLPPPDPTPD
ncbi:Hypothetical predicted protein [Marmota monax]|uniref:Uncharacterized protein n=1 Tax=Marmota monax TaxID=9995 RepID=A0A5E4B9Z4_MARMO|nr:hypothetical protein GHT09_008818 [Marmota monax]VTJ65669.1 Hypothetical predicted protein [Marmota monax]